MKDHEILERVSRGDEAALDYLYKKYYKMMTRIVLNNSGTEDEAKDVFQDALLVFWQKAISGNLVLTSKISTFIYSICLNLWRKELDRKSRHSGEMVEEATYQDIERQEKIKIVNDCINQLGDACRKILTYHYFDGLSMQDIAEKLNFANTDTAKTKKYKCKKKLDLMIKRNYTSSDFLD
ncbi:MULTISPECIES: RNA polymerase sigma factor [Reichenbachiella]|uniref:RNA polymerase sigma factor n=1 Tax=Reichenbachiella TaxID=156993 RepID=UPI000E6CD4CE|nr:MULTISPECIES: sigma-70 family RNA polymerase sigma factor [Reichenbachiella]MBU2915742.1 sigma-70 family RNA polymerase sigma factor [Reichenbachiella agariperforans]RJE71991.1 RNA polymerase subunit sigma [Reichenbachiella sp. MSK19-1]